MARGQEILIATEPKGRFLEGVLNGALLPGTVVEIDPTAATPIGGEYTYRVYTSGTDGNRQMIGVLLPDRNQGGLATTAYVTGTRCFVYVPLAGEQLNILVKANVNPTFGQNLMVENASGKLKANSGTQQSSPFQALEALTNAADALLFCQATGY